MYICFVNKMEKIMATSTRISAYSAIKARSVSKIKYFYFRRSE